MKLAVGLVVQGGKEFIDQWLKSVEQFKCMIFVVDNDADSEVKVKLINHPQMKQYHIQKNMGRNQSRDYQKILEMAREEDVDWVWNLDIDEFIPNFNVNLLSDFLLNTKCTSIGLPLFEMREDDNHYVMITDCTPTLKDARLCHKIYKVQSHFEFNEKDVHGISIPHNCPSGDTFPLPIKHFGHYSKELREKKRNYYKEHSFKDLSEQNSTWLEEDESKITIKEFDKFVKERFPIIK